MSYSPHDRGGNTGFGEFERRGLGHEALEGGHVEYNNAGGPGAQEEAASTASRSTSGEGREGWGAGGMPPTAAGYGYGGGQPPPPVNMPPRQEEQPWKARGVENSYSGMQTHEEYGISSNEDGARCEQGDKPRPGSHSGDNGPYEENGQGDNNMMAYHHSVPPNHHRSMPGYPPGQAYYPTQSQYYPPPPIAIHKSQSVDGGPLKDEENGHEDKMMMPYPQNVPPNPLRSMPSYPQGQPYYPTQYPYYPPPPSNVTRPYGSYPPPETWHAPQTSHYPHHDASTAYHVPQPHHHYYNVNTNAPHLPSSSSRGELVKGRDVVPKDKKRQRFSPSHDYPSRPPKERKCFPTQELTQPSTLTSPQLAKSVRRKKKMYSDFVGVTYNKTHAKYQACITHYRKQHYLGRYKLAVDAALAYDESARLLKGPSWKVNFPTRQVYEEAKMKELESIGKMGCAAVDVAGSLAAVAMKVEEIATTVGQSRPAGKTSSQFYSAGSVSHPPMSAHVGFHFPERHVDGKVGRNPERTSRGRYEERNTYGPPAPTKTAPSTQAVVTKVTPSPTFQIVSHPEKHNSPLISNKEQSFQTPLPMSPNPTRHTMGTKKSTPDSVIRPTVLTFRAGADGQSSAANMQKSPMPPKQCQVSVTSNSTNQVLVKPGHTHTQIAENASHHSSPLKEASQKPVTPKAKLPPSDSVGRAPPVIQNGTLAAASALMTLFGNEKSPQG